MTTTAMNTEPVPFCLIMPLMRVADCAGTESDYRQLESAGDAYAKKIPEWLAELGAKKTTCPPLQPHEWAERLLLGLEARRALSFEWVDDKDGALVSQLKNPSGCDPEYVAAVRLTVLSGACAPETTTTWSATFRGWQATGIVYQSGPRGIAAAKKAVEHAFLAAWEAAR